MKCGDFVCLEGSSYWKGKTFVVMHLSRVSRNYVDVYVREIGNGRPAVFPENNLTLISNSDELCKPCVV